MAVKTFAAIDVGSYEIGMKIYEFSKKNGMKEIDHIRQRIDLGTDTYNKGKISQERVDELCDVLSQFAQIMKAYKVEGYKACGTSAIRETENTLIVLEQIKLRTGLDIEVISNSEQRFLHYKAVASREKTFEEIIKSGGLVLDIGGGSIQLSLFDKESLITTQNIRLGILRMRDTLSDLASRSIEYERLLEELIDNQLDSFHQMYLKDRRVDNIVIVDDYVSHVIQKVNGLEDMITKEQFTSFVNLSHRKSLDSITRAVGLTEESSSLLLPSVVLIRRIFEMSGARMMWAPGVSLADGIAYEEAQKEKYVKVRHDFENDIVSCAKVMARRYDCNIERNDLLESVCDSLFENTKKLHGMGSREKLLLKIAAILNDCGRYISIEEAAESGYGIICATEMIGLSHIEREIVASIVKYNKTPFEYYSTLAMSAMLDKDDYLTIAKLTAIFRVADGICRSHRCKVNGVSVIAKDNQLVITVDSKEDIVLEKAFFERKAAFFEEVFSIKPVLKYKKKISAL